MKDIYKVTFTFQKELDKCFKVKKKTKKINKEFFIPKSISSDVFIYEQEKSLGKDIGYTRKRISINLPKWFCDKELGFYK
jgi:hypothetical protein